MPFAYLEIFHEFLSSAEFFKINFFEKILENTSRVSNSWDPDQNRRLINVGSDLSPNCLQRLSSFLVKLFAYWGIFHDFLSSADFFPKINFSKNPFGNIISESNILYPDQDRRSVGPDWSPNCSLDDSSAL